MNFNANLKCLKNFKIIKTKVKTLLKCIPIFLFTFFKKLTNCFKEIQYFK